MVVRFIENYEVSGWFEEPMYDEHPGLGTYSRNFTRYFEKGDILNFETVRDDVVQIFDESFGVSLYGSNAYLYMNVFSLMQMGIVCNVPIQEVEKKCFISECAEKLEEAQYKMNQHQDYLQDKKDVSSQDMTEYVQCIICWIHAKADYVIAKIQE